MEAKPYSIHIGHRPLRVAFLVDPVNGLSLIDGIFSFNTDKWGGAFNPIVLTDGQSIDERSWDFLERYDPDIVYSFPSLSNELEYKLQMTLSPISIHTSNGRGIFMREDLAKIFPNQKNIEFLGRQFFRHVTSLAVFGIKHDAPPVIREFIERNFGEFSVFDIAPDGSESGIVLKLKCPQFVHRIGNIKDLADALGDLATSSHGVVFSSKLCALSTSAPEPAEHLDTNANFRVTIGDTVQDLVFSWNSSLNTPQWQKRLFTHLWIPTVLAQNAELRESLSKFINGFTGGVDHRSDKRTSFFSSSLTHDQLDQIVRAYSLQNPRSIHVSNSLPHPKLPLAREGYFSERGTEMHRGSSSEEHLNLRGPNIENYDIYFGNWMLDLYVEYRPELFPSFANKRFWWRLPRRNAIVDALNIFPERFSRINGLGVFSVLMNGIETLKQEQSNNVLVMRLPSEWNIFRLLATNPEYSRSHHQSLPDLHQWFRGIELSDKGRYLNGVVSLFADLTAAHGLVSDDYWRDVFSRMINHKANRDSDLIEKIKALLERGNALKDPTTAGDVATKITSKVASSLARSVELNLNTLLEMNSPNGRESLSEEEKEDLLGRLHHLLDLGILYAGIKPKCPRCGYAVWHALRELDSKILCKGCRFSFSIEPEQAWYYRLNELISRAFSQGCRPVLLLLGQLLFDADSSFMYVPNIDLYEHDASKPPKEVDIACIKDGEFIIGEVKENQSLFSGDVFEDMEQTARRLKPDLLIFSAPGTSPSDFVKRGIQAVSDNLKPLGIKVAWVAIRGFDSSDDA